MHGTAPGAGGVLVRDARLGARLAPPLPRAAPPRLPRELGGGGAPGDDLLPHPPLPLPALHRPRLPGRAGDAGGGQRAEGGALAAHHHPAGLRRGAAGARSSAARPRAPRPDRGDPRRHARASAARRSRLALRGARWCSRRWRCSSPSSGRGGAGALRWFREHRRLALRAVTLGIFLVLTLLPGVRATGKFGGTTPWELLLPVFVGVWAARAGGRRLQPGAPGRGGGPAAHPGAAPLRRAPRSSPSSSSTSWGSRSCSPAAWRRCCWWGRGGGGGRR